MITCAPGVGECCGEIVLWCHHLRQDWNTLTDMAKPDDKPAAPQVPEAARPGAAVAATDSPAPLSPVGVESDASVKGNAGCSPADAAGPPKLDVIWNATLDGRYLVTVHRVAGKLPEGVLTIFDGDVNEPPLLVMPVGLAYGAAFGPDVADVQMWQGIAEGFIDDFKKAKH